MNKCRRLRWAGNIARIEEGRSSFKISTSKPTEKRTAKTFVDSAEDRDCR